MLLVYYYNAFYFIHYYKMIIIFNDDMDHDSLDIYKVSLGQESSSSSASSGTLLFLRAYFPSPY